MSWQRVKGHDELVAAFARAARRGPAGYGYLFTGPPGVGKRLFAVELAKTLLCESPPADRFDSCDRCSSCRLVDASTHPDLFVVARNEDKHDVIIDDVRQLSDKLAMKPARGGRKIAILDDADDLNEQSANCFLKTLEEPPPQSLLILIGTSADRQLATIRSRAKSCRSRGYRNRRLGNYWRPILKSIRTSPPDSRLWRRQPRFGPRVGGRGFAGVSP